MAVKKYDAKAGLPFILLAKKPVFAGKKAEKALKTEKSLHLAFLTALNYRIYRLVLHGWRRK